VVRSIILEANTCATTQNIGQLLFPDWNGKIQIWRHCRSAVLPRGKQLIRATNRYNVHVLRNKNANNLTNVFREGNKGTKDGQKFTDAAKVQLSQLAKMRECERVQNMQIVQRNKDYKGHMLIYQQALWLSSVLDFDKIHFRVNHSFGE
jgi:hypothetical protein